MALEKKHIFKHLVLALLPVILYNTLNPICFSILAIRNVLNSQSDLDVTEIMRNHYFEFDAQFCILMLLLFSLWLWIIHKREPMLQVPHSPYILIQIPMLALGMSGLSTLWFILIGFFLKSIPFISNSLQNFEQTWSTVADEHYLWVLISVVIAGPMVEELIFRGIMFHHLEKIKAGWFPVVISGVLFGLWHMEPVQVVYAALLGIILGMIYARVRDLKVTIAIHILNNFLSTLPPSIDTDTVQAIIFLASLLMVLPTLYILIRLYWKKEEHREQNS